MRQTVGIAHLGNGNYIGLDLGFDSGQVEFGLGAGVVDTDDDVVSRQAARQPLQFL